MDKVNVIYRVSNKGRDKNKLPNATKEHCLENAVCTFGNENIYVIADNCSQDLVEYIKGLGLKYEETSLGNIGSFKYALEYVIKTFNDDDIVYMLEDDYLHCEKSNELICEGLLISDYVTLFDHNDSYMLRSQGGSPFNHGKIHSWRLFATTNSHWRELPSTTMTVAAKVKTWKEDYKIWMKQPQKGIPKDFATFMKLTKQKNLSDLYYVFSAQKEAGVNMLTNLFSFRKPRLLICPLPARSTHADLGYVSPTVDWSKY